MNAQNLKNRILELFSHLSFDFTDEDIRWDDPVYQQLARELLQEITTSDILEGLLTVPLATSTMDQSQKHLWMVVLWALSFENVDQQKLLDLVGDDTLHPWLRDRAMRVMWPPLKHTRKPQQNQSFPERLWQIGQIKALTELILFIAEHQKNNWWDSLIQFSHTLEAHPISKAQQAVLYALHQARGCLGDRRVLRQLIHHSEHPEELNPYWKKSVQGLPVLVRSLGGLNNALKRLQFFPDHVLLEDRLFQLSQEDRDRSVRRWARKKLDCIMKSGDGTMLLEGLQDEEWLIRKKASDQLVELSCPPVELLQLMVHAEDHPREVPLWAAYTLIRLGVPVSLEHIPEYRVPISPGIPEQLRQDMVKYWAANATQYTDVRWLIEGQQLGSKPFEFSTAQSLPDAVLQAVSALRGAGYEVGEVLAAHDHHQQGISSFFMLECRPAGTVQERVWKGDADVVQYQLSWHLYLSVVGPYFSGPRALMTVLQNGITVEYEAEQQVWQDLHQQAQAEVTRSHQESLTEVLERAGWQFVDQDLLDQTLPGLNIPHLGFREPPTLEDFLFFWTD